MCKNDIKEIKYHLHDTRKHCKNSNKDEDKNESKVTALVESVAELKTENETDANDIMTIVDINDIQT